MTRLLVDTSVLIKWFHADGESELAPARAIRAAHLTGVVDVHMLDIAVYEVGNVLVRALGWSAPQVADQLDDLHVLLGPHFAMEPAWQRRAAELAQLHGLTYYDACWAAAARCLDIPLVSADRQLVAARLAETASATAERLRLSLPPHPAGS